MEPILLILLTFLNGRLAKKKNHSPILWGFLSVVAYFVVGAFATVVYFLIYSNGHISQAGAELFVRDVQRKPLNSILLDLIALGGCLLIRFILERIRPNRPPETPRG